MKTLLIHIFLLVVLVVCFVKPGFVQDTAKISKDTIKKSHFHDEPPVPPGGAEGYLKFLQKNIKYPEEAVIANGQGTVYISIVVDKDGTLSDVHIYKDMAGYGCGEEAVRVISSMPPWRPGFMDGEPVKVRYTVPVKFTLYDSPRKKAKKDSSEKQYDEAPQPPGGDDGYNQFINQHLIYPLEAIKSHVEGTVEVSLTIDKSGLASELRIEKDDIGHGCGEEAIRLIKMIPQWTPARFERKRVKVRYVTKVKFSRN